MTDENKPAVKPRVFKEGRFWRIRYAHGVSPVLNLIWERAIHDALRYDR